MDWDDFKDKVYGVTDEIGDWVPREFAEVAPYVLPFVAPYAGEGITQALGQIASFKTNDGRFDPYTGLSIHGAANSAKARKIKAAGNTWGQKLGSGIADTIEGADWYNEEGLSGRLARGFDPKQSMFKQDVMVPIGGKFENEFEKKIKDQGLVEGEHYYIDEKHALEPWQTKDQYYIKSYEENPYTAFQNAGYGDIMSGDESFWTDEYLHGERLRKPTLAVDDETGEYVIEEGTGNMPDWMKDDYLYNANEFGKEAADNALAERNQKRLLPRGNKGEKSVLAQARDQAADSYLPGFTDANGNFNLTNTTATLASVYTLGSMMKIQKELREDRRLEEAEKGKIWHEYFKQWEDIGGESYMEVPANLRDPFLEDMYRQYAAEGGRIGYNMGGGISNIIPTPAGIPQGMQLDGRGGAFIEQGIEEKADDVPAMLSKNEFVLTADAMRGLDKMMGGSGDPRAAAKTMYQTMNQLEAMA